MYDYKQTIDENYEDALFAKLMDEHAQIEGTRLLEENERLKNDPDFHMPDGLDERCIETIKNASRTNKYKKIGKTVVTVGKHVAVVILICSVIFTGLWCTASAFREAAYKLFTNDYSDNKDIQIQDSSDDNIIEKNSEQIDELPEGLTLPTWLPEDYTLKSLSCKNGLIKATYTNSLGNEILYKEFPDYLTVGIDTEDADEIEKIIINEYEGTFVSKGEKLSVTWSNTDRTTLIRISSDTISKDEILKIAESIT